jgi:cytochrome c oxidase subunit II
MVRGAAPTVALALLAALVFGCSSGPVFTAVPDDIDLSKVPTTTVAMTAEHFHFTPDVVHVNFGSLVEIAVTSIDGTHGFAVGDYGIDETIDEGETKTIRFYPRKKGEIGFHCSHLCGLGHLGMNGKVVVE